jgi:hypothetical protein
VLKFLLTIRPHTRACVPGSGRNAWKRDFSRYLRTFRVNCVYTHEINMNEEEWREVGRKEGPRELMRGLLTENSHRGGQPMRIVRGPGWVSLVSLLCVAALVLLLHGTPSVFAQTVTPPSSSISSSSGPVSWEFAAVGGGTVTNVGIQDICPPGMCDDHDLSVLLPAPAATFYQTMTAKLTIKYTWTSTVPTDLDIFAISPSGVDRSPGAPDDTSTGPGEEDPKSAACAQGYSGACGSDNQLNQGIGVRGIPESRTNRTL